MEEPALAPQPQVSAPAAVAENAADGDPLPVEIEADRVESEEEQENAGNAQIVDLVSDDSNDCTLGKRARDQFAELRQRAATAAAAAAAQSSVDFGGDEALSDCPICFEPWGSSGDHRVCCLACGHLFGMSCIQTWLRSTKKCPSCNARAKKGDIRPIWAPKLVATDTSARDEALAKCQAEQNKRIKVEAENARLKMTLRMLQSQMASMRSNVHQAAGASGHGSHYQQLLMANSVYSNAKPQPQPQAASSVPQEAEAFAEPKFLLPLDGGRSVCFAPCPGSPLAIYASCKQGQSEYGLCKIDVEQSRPVAQYTLHASPIKAIAYDSGTLASEGAAVATVSFDRKMKVITHQSGEAIATCNLPNPGWSVCWSENRIWVGGQGVVSLFDLRQCSEPMKQIRMPSLQPVHSLWNAVSSATGETIFAVNGQGVFAFSARDSNAQPTLLLSLDESLSTARLYRNYVNSAAQPTIEFLTCVRGEHARVGQYTLDLTPDVSALTPRLLRNYRGHSNRTIMSKPCFIESSRGAFVAAADEATCQVRLWDHATGAEVGSLPANLSPVYDIDSFVENTSTMIATLCDRQLQVFSR